MNTICRSDDQLDSVSIGFMNAQLLLLKDEREKQDDDDDDDAEQLKN